MHLRPAAPGQYDTEPVKAALADLSYNVGNIVGKLFGIEQVRDAINVLGNKDASAGDKVLAVVNSALANVGGLKIFPAFRRRKAWIEMNFIQQS